MCLLFPAWDTYTTHKYNLIQTQDDLEYDKIWSVTNCPCAANAWPAAISLLLEKRGQQAAFTWFRIVMIIMLMRRGWWFACQVNW